MILALQNTHTLLEQALNSQVQDTLTAKGQRCLVYINSKCGSGHLKTHLSGVPLNFLVLWPLVGSTLGWVTSSWAWGRGIPPEIPHVLFCNGECFVWLAAKVDNHAVEHICGCLQYHVDEWWGFIIFNMLTAYTMV